jgi:hypothetical protein
MTHELAPGADPPPRPERAPDPPPPASGHTIFIEFPHQGSLEAGYRLAISDLESFWQQLDPDEAVDIARAIVKLTMEADTYWPQEEIT